MANNKIRVKTPQGTKCSISKGKNTKQVKRLNGKNGKSNDIVNHSDLSPTEKVALFLQTGHLLRQRLTSTDENIVKDSKLIKKVIKMKSRSNLNLLSEILKSELLIGNTEKSIPENTLVYNNNEAEFDNNDICGRNKLDKNRNNVRKTSTRKIKNSSKTKECPEKLKPSNTELNISLSMYQCDYCQKTFTTKSSLQRHIFVHLDIKPFKCNFCMKRFRQKGNLRSHVEKIHFDEAPTTFTCNDCDKSFALKENLTLHLASHVKSENVHQCVYCDEQFTHKLSLVEHEKQHLVAGKFQCTLCTTSYNSRSRLALHVKSHLNINDFVCEYCSKEFLRRNSIKRHIEMCHRGQKIQCPICRKMLKGHLAEHLRTHDKARPHECPDCGQRFTQSTQLTVHRRSHSGVKPYPCRICDRPFSHSNALMLHIRRHTGERPFACSMCPMSFSQLPHMKSHMMKIHGKKNPYKCPKCHDFFKLKIHLDNHTKACTVGVKELTFEEKLQASLEGPEVEPPMSLSRMRFLLALLLTMIATKDRLKYLGFNKRLIDDILIESLEAMGQMPCRDDPNTLSKLKKNIQILLNGTIPESQMVKFRQENKSTEELLVLLTDDKK